jgi:hypothetical protein
MPTAEQLSIMCVFGLLLILYAVGLVIRYTIVYWYVTVPTILTLVTLIVWRRRHVACPVDDEWEPVNQE